MLAKLFGSSQESGADKKVDLMKSSLVDLTTVNLMIADLSGKILYMNDSVEQMLRGRESKIKEALPNFNVSSIVGSNFAQYHKNPAHQQNLLSNPDNLPYESEIEVAGLSFRLKAFALRDSQGIHIGNAVQWEDITEHKKRAVEIGRLASTVENATVNIMMADNDGNIMYMNPAVQSMLKGRETQLRTVIPDFSVDKLIGQNFDRFHRNPAHQRNLLADESKLPYQSEINVAGLDFRLTAFALKDNEGNRIGSSVQWEDITEEKIANKQIGQLTSTVENATVNIMMADNNFNITYMNPSLIKTLKRRESQVRRELPGFDVDKLIGKNIDEFHKNPSHQRSILSDENRLPFSSDITVAGIKFRLTAFSLKDKDGNRIGSCVQWEDLMADEEFANFAGQIHAISKSNAVIEFKMDGTIMTANDNFCNVLGYRESEIVGQHHRIFVESSEANSREYQQFWEQLGRGEFQTGEYKRITKSGEEIWISASYNPILDMDGKPFKVVKYATDVTPRVRAVALIRDALQSLSDGDLTKPIEEMVDPDFETLKQAMNTTIERLNSMVISIIEASSHVSSSAKEISLGNADLSQRTEEQASSLEETASSMEEFTSTVRENASNAKNASTLADNAKELAEKGGLVVGKTVEAMQEIEASSKKISDIIGVIDEIAFQTNLLALNASVEAARAGDQGRGFAVVAAEVRNLAQRSADAAKEIKELIQDSVTKVSDGSKLVAESGDTLNDIVSSVADVSKIINDIDNASQEQASGIEQVNEAVSQMDEMTQQNAALVEEAAASAESLEEQSANLLEMMRFFNTGDDNVGKRGLKSPVKRNNVPAAQPQVGGGDDDWEEF
ncbi:methyl-accepting chemotaxis protein [Pleionea litopenaei]|uniref:Methyl-accepting chemotaxis protein n=1 Tax=Pleionea litopenaei TaxID=3070815 RepID=A0AA51RU62_9GAMM|nr:methyl-accepting chemotaxis protein [Pleionea sp. HL-JVS1]WMS87672.1 methyl-accepting chemotaxis protein [Pleionea sp. HL-JVS1]